MSTYLQGVTDYIPDYQPFQPDLNFYNNVLQTKQTQYDTNYKSLNNLYSELHNADLTHDQNIKKKDEMLKQIDFNLKRVTGLDLSLEQNVDEATQVFRPFYEDKYLMKDMAYTKNYNSTLSSALNLQNAQDEKIRNQFSPISIRELQYRREEFKEATLEETLNMSNVRYTPNVDVVAKYQKIAKDSGLNFDIKDVDDSGLYFVHEKGGQKLIAPLQSLFLSAYANDPELQAKYTTEAYVKRKDWAVQHASEYQGSKAEAEKVYLKDQYNFLKNYTAKQNEKAQEDVKVNKNLISSAEEDMQNNEEGIFTGSLLDRLNKAITINQTVADHTEQVHNEVTNANSEEGAQADLDLSNIELARLRVDAGTASWSAEQGIMSAAQNEAFRDYKYEKSVNQVGLEGLRQQNALSRMGYAHDLKIQEMDYKAVQDRETNRINQGLADGTIYYDKNGVMHEDDGASFTITTGSESGQFTDEVNIMAKNNQDRNEAISNLTSDYIGTNLQRLRTLAQTGQITNQQLWTALSNLDPNSKEATERYGTKANSNLSGYALLNTLWGRYQADPTKFVQNFTKTNQVTKLKTYMDKWASNMNGNKLADEYLADPTRQKVEQYARYRENMEIIDKNNYAKISKGLISAMDEMGYDLKPETKQKIADLYVKTIKTGKDYDEAEFTDFVNKSINYAKPPTTIHYEKELQGIIGKEKSKELNNYLNKERQKWHDKNFWKTEEGKKIAQNPNMGKAFQEHMDKLATQYVYQNINDAEFKKMLAKDVWKHNRAVEQRAQADQNTAFGDITPKENKNYKKNLQKSPYDFTKEELDAAKRKYVSNLNKLDVAHGNLYESGRVGFSEKTGVDMGDLLDGLSKSYLKVVNKTGPEQIQSYSGIVRTPGGRYALGSNQITAKNVNLANPSYGGFQDFQEIMQDINRIRFNQDSSKYAVTSGGLTKGAAEDTALDAAEMKAMLRELQLSAGKKTKTEKFIIGRSPIAMESADLKAVVIIPPQSFLEKYIKKEVDGKTVTDWNRIKEIKKNGISFIAPKSQWTNNFVLDNELTPTEQILNAKGKIKYVSPNKAGTYTIEKISNVPGVDYSINSIGYAIGPDGNVQELPQSMSFKKTGNYLDESEASVYKYILKLNEHNEMMMREFRRTGNTEALQRAQKHFNTPAKNGGFQ